MNKYRIVVVSTDEWKGVYMNDTLRMQGTEVDYGRILEKYTPCIIESYKAIYAPQLGELEKFGNMFPSNLKELKL